jgi:hypothetical protein
MYFGIVLMKGSKKRRDPPESLAVVFFSKR